MIDAARVAPEHLNVLRPPRHFKARTPSTRCKLANKFYVYVLFDWLGRPFYVGAGSGKRWRDHEYFRSNTNIPEKDKIIRQTISKLGELPRIKLFEDIATYREACAIESAIIRAIGSPPLTNSILTPKQYSDRSRRANASQTPEQHTTRAKKANQNRDKKAQSEKLSSKKTAWWATLSAKDRSALARKSFANTSEQKREARRIACQLANHGHPAGGEWAKQHAAKISKLIWANNGYEVRRLPKDQPLPDGWIRGRKITNASEL